MSHNLIDLTGKIFGKLKVIQRKHANSRGNCMWECICECGNFKDIESISLRRGQTKSCGCIWQPSWDEYVLKLKKRILDNSEKEGDCWIWKKKKNIYGYGETKIRSKRFMAHRASYLAFKGDIPEGMYVCHTCDNPICVNPDHLWIGSHTDNVRDMMHKGRSNFGGVKTNKLKK